MRAPSSFGVLLAALTHAQAQFLISELSFGNGHRYAFSGSPARVIAAAR